MASNFVDEEPICFIDIGTDFSMVFTVVINNCKETATQFDILESKVPWNSLKHMFTYEIVLLYFLSLLT